NFRPVPTYEQSVAIVMHKGVGKKWVKTEGFSAPEGS
ncbi:MAG: hypothetical protein ACI9TH_001962, partial [Kiritimatiellia bacterium]